MDKTVGIVGFAFGLRTAAREPNPSNIALAFAVARAKAVAERNGSRPVVATQWEITKALKQLYDASVDHSVELREDGTYLDSKGVWKEAKAEFARHGIHQVIVIAQPFLHLTSVKKMVTGDGYEVVKHKIGPIPFDDSIENTQPWTRSKLALAIYAAKSLIPGAQHGHSGMQSAS